jgi:D-alanine--poly(phosphoribitol) ligase subunit 1
VGDRILVLAARSPVTVVAALAIWKIGAIYCPIDPEMPEERFQHIVQSLRPVATVGNRSSLERFQGSEITGSTIDIDIEYLARRETYVANFPIPGLVKTSPAVIIHTSGSTGIPKGAVLSHGSVLSFFKAYNEHTKYDQDSVGMNNGPFFFDISMQDTFTPLFYSSKVIFHSGAFLAPRFIDMIIDHRVTHLIVMTTVLKLITQSGNIKRLAELASLTIMAGGEVSDPKLYNQWIAVSSKIRLFNCYGPTENNSLSLAYQVSSGALQDERGYPIGTPFEGVDVLLLGKDEEVITQPETPGTLCLGGEQLMDGYWNDEERSRISFRFIDGRRYYWTGDQAYQDRDGLFHFLGRGDTQVKINGYRIELNEIRSALFSKPDVTYGLVGCYHSGNATEIYVVFVVEEGAETSHREVLDYLRKRLPLYMVPFYLIRSDVVPATATNKANEHLLAKQAEAAISTRPMERFLNI